MREYKVVVNGEEIVYGALVQRSRFSDEEWEAIYHKMVAVNRPDLYETKSDDNDYISVLGSLIDMEERYEALLELLPQDSFSEAGAHPEWVAEAVEANTFRKDIAKYDVADILNNYTDGEELNELKSDLIDYLELDKD